MLLTSHIGCSRNFQPLWKMNFNRALQNCYWTLCWNMKSSRHSIPAMYRYNLILLSSHLRSDFTFKVFKIHTDTLFIKDILVKCGFSKKKSLCVLLKNFLVNEGLNCIFRSTHEWIWAIHICMRWDCTVQTCVQNVHVVKININLHWHY
jgi:hypothetical protein